MLGEDKKVIVFSSEDGSVDLNVSLEKEMVWLSLKQMANLFERDKSVISRHIKKIFQDRELDKNQVVAFFATTAADGKTYNVECFNLDVVLSVGYRVNSQRGIEFRRWSNKILSGYILNGYSLNEKRISEKGFADLTKSLELVKRALFIAHKIDDIGIEALSIVQNYAKSWSLLLSYDENKLERILAFNPLQNIDTQEIEFSIKTLKKELVDKGEASQLFGQLRLGSNVRAIFDSVNQTFGTEMLYPSLEERAAHVLYFVIKNHPFVDGNKRIGSFLFLLYLRLHQFDCNKITNEALVALALLVAQSDREEKELMIQLIVHLLIK